MSVSVEAKVKKEYMARERLNTYIACEEYDFTWDLSEVEQFREMWREGLSIMDMSKTLRRHQCEIAILVIDQAEQARINPRVGGLLGSQTDGVDGHDE